MSESIENQNWVYFRGENVLNSHLFEGYSKRYNTKLRSTLMEWILRKKSKPENKWSSIIFA